MILGKKKKLRYLRSIWSNPVEKYRNFDLISAYNSMLNKGDKNNFVDEKTWADLNFNAIFTKMDRNITSIGQQYLYHKLHKYQKNSDELKKQYGIVNELRNNSKTREQIQLNILNLSDTNAYFIPYLILGKDIPYTPFYFVFYILSFLSLLSMLLIFVNGIFLFAALSILLTNLVLDKIFSKNIYNYFSGFSSLNSLIHSAIAISKINSEYYINDIESLKKKSALLRKLRKRLGYLVLDKQAFNELIVVLIEYMNLFFLFDLISYYRSVKILRKYQEDIREVYEAVANLDASISIASYLEEIQYFCNPVFTESCQIKFSNLYHPLIDNAVSNSIDELKNSALITGSNMSGKTTFIKTVGINFILSQTLYISLAEKFSIPNFKVKSSIKRDEDLDSGKSYFFVEIEALQQFIELSQNGGGYLFLIDEIFRGTNTIERLAASTAVLKHLDNKNMVLVTTHDIELQYLLEQKYKMFHFSERVENNRFFFDYKIQEGASFSGNAIKLLEIKKYPGAITETAKALSKQLSTQSLFEKYNLQLNKPNEE